jgi:hypothetical protein
MRCLDDGMRGLKHKRECGKVMPVPRNVLMLLKIFLAEHMNRGRLFPEGSLWKHKPWFGGWKSQAIHLSQCVALDLFRLRRLARGSCPEF